MKKFLAIVMCIACLVSCFTFGSSAATVTEKDGNVALQFNEDGNFRILNICDIQDDTTLSSLTREFLEKVVPETNPDLIVLDGDNVCPDFAFGSTVITRTAINNYMSIFEEYGIPVVITFGNHDVEYNISKAKQIEIYKSYDCYIGVEDGDLTGDGNQCIPILSSDGSKTAFNIFLIDSLTYNKKGSLLNECYYENDLGGYGCVHKDQIEWYKNTANAAKEENGGETIPSFVFQHIVVPEIYDALVKNDDGTYSLPEGATGKLGEDPCPPKYSNGEFDAMVETGDVQAIFTAHDHTNSFDLTYKGIRLINTPGVGFHSYGCIDRGVRVIDINENDPTNWTTELVNLWETLDGDNNKSVRRRYILQGDEFSFIEKLRAFFCDTDGIEIDKM